VSAPADPHPRDQLRANLHALQERIEAARGRTPHGAATVELVVVTKAQPAEVFPLLVAAGVDAIGENRVQSAAQRRRAAPPGLIWHGIGHLQRNKARTAIDTFDVFHALDGPRLARHLETVLAAQERIWPVYLQVNAAEDEAKGGVRPAEALRFLDAVRILPHLRTVGFMTMARLGADESETRRAFATLREVRDEALRRGACETPPAGLSMGMSGDFEIAVEEGATVVRVGRAAFEGVGTLATPVSSDLADDTRSGGDPS